MPKDFFEQVKSRIASGDAPREFEPVGMQVVWNALFRPAYIKVPLQLAAVAVVVLVAFIMTRPDYYPPGAPDGILRFSRVGGDHGVKRGSQGVESNINRVVVRSSNPGAAVIITQAIAQSCMGNWEFVRRESSNEGKVWVLAVELPQNQVATFQKNLAEAQKTASADSVKELFHPSTGQIAQEPPKDFVPGIEDMVNKGIGAGAVTITSKAGDGSISGNGIPKDQPEGRHGMVTIEVEIRSVESHK